MPINFIVNFRMSKRQNISKGRIVTYLDEFRLSVIKENLTLKTDFFVVDKTDMDDVYISNGVDNITSTTGQLIEVVPYLEEVPPIRKPYPNTDANKYLRDLIKWNEYEEVHLIYPLKDNFLSIMSAGLQITDKDFVLESTNGGDETGKKMIFASLIPERISLYL